MGNSFSELLNKISKQFNNSVFDLSTQILSDTEAEELITCLRSNVCIEDIHLEEVKVSASIRGRLQAVLQYNQIIAQKFREGCRYDFGTEKRTKNLKHAETFYREAAKEDHVVARNNLGVLCEEKGNFEEALAWYRTAAERGFAIAQCNMGRMFRYGRGIRVDLDRAALWFEKAEKQGNAAARKGLEEVREAIGKLTP